MAFFFQTPKLYHTAMVRRRGCRAHGDRRRHQEQDGV